MSKSKHTPGPWTVVREVDIRFCSKTGKRLLDFKTLWIRDSNNLTISLISSAGPSHEQEENARLIAAAPELLEALKEAFRVIEKDDYRIYREDGFMSGIIQRQIMDAIAKAEGKVEETAKVEF